MAKSAAKLLLPVGEKAEMRGLGGAENSHAPCPLTLPSPPRGEGK
jgi:hypothetical protein